MGSCSSNSIRRLSFWDFLTFSSISQNTLIMGNLTAVLSHACVRMPQGYLQDSTPSNCSPFPFRTIRVITPKLRSDGKSWRGLVYLPSQCLCSFPTTLGTIWCIATFRICFGVLQYQSSSFIVSFHFQSACDGRCASDFCNSRMPSVSKEILVSSFSCPHGHAQRYNLLKVLH